MKRSFKSRLRRALVWIRLRVPPGLRLLLGFILMVGGAFGILPVLGFWMIPLGVMVMMLDIRPIWLRLTRRPSDTPRPPRR